MGQIGCGVVYGDFESRLLLRSVAGDTGEGACEWLKFLLMKEIQIPLLKILFPTAPEHPYTPLGGEVREKILER